MADANESFFRYIPVRPRDTQWGLYVCGAGCAIIPRGTEYPPQGHPELYDFDWHKGRSLPEYQVLYIANGHGVFESAITAPERFGPGTVLLLFPGVWHRYRPEQATGWEEYWVSFNGEQMERLVANHFFLPEQPVLQTGVQPGILASYKLLLDRLRETPPGFPHLVAANVIEILAAVVAVAKEETEQLILQGPRDVTALKDRLVSEALRLIWTGSHHPLTVERLARQLDTTSRSLERRFQQALGRTVREEILRCRLDRVRRLLVETDLPIAEIVTASGFSSPDAMVRALQRAEGMTPLKYRLQHGGGKRQAAAQATPSPVE